MSEKRVTPYQRLVDAVRTYRRGVKYPHTITMWVYPKDKLGDRWTLSDLHERVAAANQIGYDVVLTTDETGLVVKYVKRAEDIDYFIG